MRVVRQATSGEPGDADNFSEFVKANLKLYELRHAAKLSTHAAANYTRNELATAIRKARRLRQSRPVTRTTPTLTRPLGLPVFAQQGPYQVNLLIAGWDVACGPSLYYLDYMGCLHKMSCAAHGYGGSFVLSLFDKAWRPGLSVDEAVGLCDAAIAEVRSRLVVAPPSYVIKVVDKDGARVLAERKSEEVVNTS